MTNETWNDAGLLRQYVVDRFAHQLAAGFHQEAFSRALRLCTRIAQLTGGDRDAIFNDIAAEVQ